MYLSLSPYLDIGTVLKIDAVEPQFYKLSIPKKLSAIATYSSQCEGIIFYRDYLLATLFIVLYYRVAKHKNLVFHEFYLPPSATAGCKYHELKFVRIVSVVGKSLILTLSLKYLFRSFNKIIVHSSEEVRYLSKRYNEPAEKFEFIPYFFYESDGDNAGCKQLLPEPLFCSAGNNRDFDTFTQALLQTQSRGRMNGGSSQRILASQRFI